MGNLNEAQKIVDLVDEFPVLIIELLVHNGNPVLS
jgi:hypothetical protein